MNGVLVAGGGLAGAAAAAGLARAGIAVTVIERETTPHDKICGDFLSTEAQAYLNRLGLDLASLGGHSITHVRLVHGTRIITAKLPFRGLGLSRKLLDEALLNHAAAQGATLCRGAIIRGAADDDVMALQVSRLGTLRPETLFLATGKHDVRGLRRAANPPDLTGFKMYFTLSGPQRDALAGHVELLMFDGGYAGLQLVENNQANLCLLADRAAVKRAGGKWPALLASLCGATPHLAARLAGAVALLPAPMTIARVPYGFIHRSHDPAALFRLGDQAAVIHSFTGDGMSIALHSAALAAATYLKQQPSAVYRRQLARDFSGQLRNAALLYRLLNAPLARPALFAAARAWPAALALAAGATRIPARARLL